MAEKYDVVVKVISQKGVCGAGHKVGEKWAVSDKTPAGICLSAFAVLYPSIRTLMFGGTFPWSSDKDTNVAACPDADNPVVFEIRRIIRK